MLDLSFFLCVKDGECPLRFYFLTCANDCRFLLCVHVTAYLCVCVFVLAVEEVFKGSKKGKRRRMEAALLHPRDLNVS